MTKARNGRRLLLDERKDAPYVNNTITSSKYTLLSFLPRQLIAQFSKLANCYFFIVAIMQLVPSWSTTGTTTTIIPLSIFVSISIAREGWDDLRRHRLDKLENEHVTRVVKNGDDAEDDSSDSSDADSVPGPHLTTAPVVWKNLRVGDLVKLTCDEWVPADIVLLTSSNDLGEAFVETMALDGETNLKSRTPCAGVQAVASRPGGIKGLRADVRCEDPNMDLYNFEGTVSITDTDNGTTKKFPLGPENVAYRGSIIRNTAWCVGVVIFTGEETKIRMNAIKRPRIKAPKLQRSINIIVIFMVLIVVCFSVFGMMAERLLYKRFGKNNWYLYNADAGVAASLMGFIIMMNTMIPLSLYVTMEIIKIIQMLLMQWDIDMYDADSNTPAEVRSATILEELGQVSYVFSDKTGTLTDNKMVFREMSVAGVAWDHLGNDEDETDGNTDSDSGSSRNGNSGTHSRNSDIANQFSPPHAPFNSPQPFRPSVEQMGRGSVAFTGRPSMASLVKKESRKSGVPKNEAPDTEIHSQSTVELIEYIQEHPTTLYAKKAKMFLLSVALCHTCLLKKGKTGDGDDDDNDGSSSETDSSSSSSLQYQASSPDELALVQAACDMGFIFYGRQRQDVTLKLYPRGFDQQPVLEHYQVLEVIDFTSSRKRMSVVVRFPDGNLYLLCKGADNVILDRLGSKQIVGAKRDELAKTIGARKRKEADIALEDGEESVDEPGSPLAKLSGRLSGRTSGRLSRAGRLSGLSDRIGRLSDEAGFTDAEVAANSHELNRPKKSIHFNSQQAGITGVDTGLHSSLPTDSQLRSPGFLVERTLKHVEQFSSNGLRTLLYAYKPLDEATFDSWNHQYTQAKMAVKDRSQKVEEAGGLIESDGLRLLGCTAIEDKLQDGVPETIEKLRRAGMKMWMLTGDKRETAINIGYSCRLIKDFSKLVILSLENSTLAELSSLMNAAEIELDEGNVAHCVVVVDGATLTEISKDLTVMSVFISLGVKADSVICCRASPSQKAELVGRVRALKKGQVTLAIGDGANDIAMIQNADVGVGITGREGLQAARASDYSIARFRFLQKLLLVHGRYNYVRTSRFVLCTFYKELMFYLTQFLYQRFTLFTGPSLYEPWSLSMYNTLFTSLTVMFVGMFDMDLRPSTLIAVPELYGLGRLGQCFNLRVFIQWMLLGASQSVTLFYTLCYIYGFNATRDNTTYPLGNALYTAIIVLVSTKCCIIETHNISKLPLIAWIISVGGWLVWMILLVGLNKNRLQSIFYVNYGITEHFGHDVTFWAAILALLFVGLFMDLIYHFLHGWIHPSDTDLFQQLEQKPSIREKLELLSYSTLKQGWSWLHESQIDDTLVQSWPTLKRFDYHVRSFLRKGTTHTSNATRRRQKMMVAQGEHIPNDPTVVTLSTSGRYKRELLPSGKIIKKKINPYSEYDTLGSRRPRQRGKIAGLFGKKNKFPDGATEAEENADIDVILQQRMKGLEEQ